MKWNNLLLCIGLVISVQACDTGKIDTKAASFGKSDEIYLLMSPSLKKSKTGLLVDSILLQQFSGLGTPEPRLSYAHNYHDFKGIRKNHHHLVYVIDLDSITEVEEPVLSEIMQQGVRDSLTGIYLLSDLFARNQRVVAIVGQGNQLYPLIYKQRKALVKQLEATVLRRKTRFIQSMERSSEHETLLRTTLGIEGVIPASFSLAATDSDFCWFRNPGDDYDLNLVVAKMEGGDSLTITDSLIVAWRDRLGRKYIQGKETSIYLQTEKSVPLYTERTTVNDIFAWEFRGLWIMKGNSSMGGSFLSYVIHDEKTGSYYYLEGFVYAPGQPLKNRMREFELILKTFQPV